MGRRGPLPLDPDSRAARGSRNRSPKPLRNDALRAFWSKSAAELEQKGMALIREAMGEPTTSTPSNGTQTNPQITAGFKFLDQAAKFYERLGRVPKDDAPAAGGAKKPRSLADYRRA